MPSDAPAIKRERVAADGAEIVVVGTASDERQAVAERIAAERGLAIIPPFDDDRIIAGQGTVGLEIVEALPDVAAVLVPIGGGGLASGVAVAIRALVPDARVIGVEPELAADARESLAAGRIVTLVRGRRRRGRSPTGRGRGRSAAGRSPTSRACSTRSSRCREAEIAAAVRLAAEESRLVVEPSGALSVAALAFHAGGDRPRSARRRPVVAVVSRRQRRPGALPRVPRARRSRRAADSSVSPVALLGQPLREARLRAPGSRPARRRPGGPLGAVSALLVRASSRRGSPRSRR